MIVAEGIRVQVCEITATIAGNENFPAKPVIALEQGDGSTCLGGNYGRPDSGRATSDDNCFCVS